MSPGNVMKTMLVHGHCGQGGEESRLVRALGKRLSQENMETITAADAEEAMILFDKDVQAALIDWNLENDAGHQAARLVLANIRQRKSDIPVFLFVTDHSADALREDVLAMVDGFIWILEDETESIAQDVLMAIRRYNTIQLPYVFNANEVWGASCLSTNDGWNYFDFFGQRMVYSDNPVKRRLPENAAGGKPRTL